MYKLLIISLFITPLFSAFSQNREVFDFIRNTDQGELTLTSDFAIEILLVGTFHFKKKFLVPDVARQIINFNPEMLFIEEVPPSEHEQYLKDIYRKRSINPYKKAIDSAVSFTGISKAEADEIITQLKGKRNLSLEEQATVTNALIIKNDESNAFLYYYRAQQEMSSDDFQRFRSMVTPMHLKRTYCLGETQFLAIPIALDLRIGSISQMDYQVDRVVNDSLLEIAQRKLLPRQLWKLWKLPYFLKMMKLNKGPKDNDEANRHFRILNKWGTIVNMARMNEKYLNKPSVPASIQWNEVYRKRNTIMINRVKEQSGQTGARKIAIVVGAGHLPYFIYEIKKQFNNASIRFLEVSNL